MKALTVCQPYAAALIHGPKRIENRKWFMKHRGLLAIHAGKSRDWLDSLSDAELAAWPDFDPAALAFGAVLGVVTVNDCERLENQGVWASGPWCILCADPVPLPEPIPWLGALGLFDVPDELIWAQLPDLKDTWNGPPKMVRR